MYERNFNFETIPQFERSWVYEGYFQHTSLSLLSFNLTNFEATKTWAISGYIIGISALWALIDK